jgi:hypothetical protein
MLGPNIIDIDAAVFNNYFYVVYLTQNTYGYLRRFNTNNGNYDSDFGALLIIGEGAGLREVALASTEDLSPHTGLHCFAILNNNSLGYYFSEDTTITSWGTVPPGVANADRGLDACCNEGYASEYVWCSYIGTNDSIYIGSEGSTWWNSYGPLTDVYIPISVFSITSIGAYGDTVMVLYPYCGGEFAYFVNSCASYNGGNSWEYEGSLFGPHGTTWGASDITARKGDGFGTVMTCSNYGLYRHRDYPAGAWSDTVHFTGYSVRSQVKPSIERIATNSYGIVYVDNTTQGAWFDISQWPSGVEENTPDGNEVSLIGAIPSVFSNRTSIEYFLSRRQNISLDVYDLLGNHIKNLVRGEVFAGNHSISWDGKDDLGNFGASGVYVCVLKAYNDRSISKKVTLIK